MRHDNATADDLRRLGMWLTVEVPQLREVLDLAVDTVLQVAKAGFWVEAKAAERAVEVPFAFAHAQAALMNSVIDLMFEHSGGIKVIDYKTDLDASARTPAYLLQLETYDRALAAVGATDSTSGLAFVRVEAPDEP